MIVIGAFDGPLPDVYLERARNPAFSATALIPAHPPNLPGTSSKNNTRGGSDQSGTALADMRARVQKTKPLIDDSFLVVRKGTDGAIGGPMGRRRHPRYVMSNSQGTLQVVTDVTVRRDARGDLIAISDQPVHRGEVLAIELMNDARVRTPVRVTDVRPIVVSGSIRHCLRLAPIEKDDDGAGSSPEDR